MLTCLQIHLRNMHGGRLCTWKASLALSSENHGADLDMITEVRRTGFPQSGNAKKEDFLKRFWRERDGEEMAITRRVQFPERQRRQKKIMEARLKECSFGCGYCFFSLETRETCVDFKGTTWNMHYGCQGKLSY